VSGGGAVQRELLEVARRHASEAVIDQLNPIDVPVEDPVPR
jgi:hypothetical protein